ncbi:hypothetical protein N658DRAFT_561117 [Parathielavia hyrcaniae]|uniref:Protein kinase domain-containing protein n=1 Tax=Parathielavia hyrcaniae TaxID=113614 RepID=A0AAN6PZS9_9PEZI|nr:hypothetical protein N658DRAFT_561117 [Parathielavia hyrcaniae]
MLELRRLAKTTFFTPEQFCAEWDWIFPNHGPNDLHPRARVAGKYSWKTNLFQVGLSEDASPYSDSDSVASFDDRSIDGDAPDDPTDSDAHLDHGDDFSDLDGDCDGDGGGDGNGNGNGNNNNCIRAWSYGGYVLDDRNPVYRRVDRDLRRLVARCLCRDPLYRPALGVLLWGVGRYMRRKYGAPAVPEDNSDEAMRLWVRELFDNPSRPQNGQQQPNQTGQPGQQNQPAPPAKRRRKRKRHY